MIHRNIFHIYRIREKLGNFHCKSSKQLVKKFKKILLKNFHRGRWRVIASIYNPYLIHQVGLITDTLYKVVHIALDQKLLELWNSMQYTQEIQSSQIQFYFA